MREWYSPHMDFLRASAAELFVMAAIGFVLGLLGPFGTFALAAAIRVPAWLLLAFAGYACFRPVLAAGIALHERTALPRLAAIAIACVLAAVPTTLATVAIFTWLRIGRWRADEAAAIYPQVLLVGAIATAIQLALFRNAVATPAIAADAPPPPPAPALTPAPASAMQAPSEPLAADDRAPPVASFLDRLPPAHRDILCLEMEDHYVRAHGAAGSALILMRMRDAVAELATIEGMRVHRSWWVARKAVAGVIRRDRAVSLRLVNGLEVPVARAEVPALRAAGWLS